MRAKIRILIALFMVLAVTASYSVNLQGMMIYATEDTETIELQNDAETDSAKSEEVDGSDAKSEERTDATPQDSAEENASAEDGEDSDADAAAAESEEAVGSDVSDEAVAGTLVNTDTSYRVTVTFSEDAGIPEGAELIVAEKPEAEYIDRAEKELNAEEVAFAVFLDISIVKDGKEIPVSDDVKVEVTMGDMPSDAEGEMSVVHFADDSGAAEAVTCSTVENTVQFEAESFSVYGFLLKANAVVDSGYGNVEHTVGWELTEENGRNILTFKLLDGASTDGTPQYLAGLKPTIPLIYTSAPDHGIYDAMNKGIAMAHGEYCIFMNAADTFVGPQALEEVVAQGMADDVVCQRL